MKEELKAEPAEIAGLAKLATQIGVDTSSAANFLSEHGTPLGDFSGDIMQTLLSPLNAFKDATTARIGDLASNNNMIGVELNRAAWMYIDADARNYDALNANILMCYVDDSQFDSQHRAPDAARDFPSPAPYQAPEKVELDPPATASEDIRQVISDSAGWLGDVDDAIAAVSGGWSPLDEAIKPIAGNWNELKRLGESYKVAGEAVENSGKNLVAGTRQVGGHWDGKAAIAFEEYSSKQSDALEWEGPVGRVVKAALEAIADEIKKAATEVVNDLADMLKEEVSLDDFKAILKVAVKKIPFAGTAWQIYCIEEIIRKTADRVTTLVNAIKELVEALKSFLAAVVDPSGAVNDKFEEKLAPITGKVKDGKKKLDLGQDIKDAADMDGPLHKPTQNFDVGPDPWADA